jgi:hypothetical protein
MKSILDPSFKYRPSTQTNLRKTFARVRRELQVGPDRPAPAAERPIAVKLLKLEQAKREAG